jgi:hypothetical protein
MSKGPISHIFIPDTQVKPGHSIRHLEAAGRYVADKAPNVLVLAGDWWDMQSLSSYDKGSKSAEGRRVSDDFRAGNEAMDRFLSPIRQRTRAWRKMRRVFTVGNHEQRIERAVEAEPTLFGTISYRDLNLDAFEVYPFLEIAKIHGVNYSHFFPRAASGNIMQNKRGAPGARAQVVRQGASATAGHQQGLDISPLVLNGRIQWGLIAGSFYQHEEHYLTPQGFTHWKGIVVKHDVNRGNYCPMLVDLPYLLREWSK